MVIISQCICLLNHVVHLTYIQSLFVNYTSVKLGGKNVKVIALQNWKNGVAFCWEESL